MNARIQPFLMVIRQAGLLAVALSALAAGAMAAQPAGELILNQGVVKLRHEQQDRIYGTPGLRLPVFVGDHVQTAHGTRAQVALRDGRVIASIYPNYGLPRAGRHRGPVPGGAAGGQGRL